MKSNLILVFLISLIFFNCTEQREFKEAKILSEYPQTEFLPTLENKIPKDKNAVYCVTLLYAWEEIRKTIKIPLQINSKENTADLVLLNNSTLFKNVLNDDEYLTSVNVEGGNIIAKAEFNKSLPFEFDLNSFDNELIFDGIKVASFGSFGGGKDAYKTIKILYYKNNNEFIIKLLPKDQQHEIILFKTKKKFENFDQMNIQLEKNRNLGEKEQKKQSKYWKYYLQDEDELIIPKFNFNIETNYSSLEGNQIKTSKNNYVIGTAWQRTAFILDEKGAKIESEVVIEALLDEMEEEEKPKPKKMRFDKPFFVLLKKTNSTTPYFTLFANNAELMVKE